MVTARIFNAHRICTDVVVVVVVVVKVNLVLQQAMKDQSGNRLVALLFV